MRAVDSGVAVVVVAVVAVVVGVRLFLVLHIQVVDLMVRVVVDGVQRVLEHVEVMKDEELLV